MQKLFENWRNYLQEQEFKIISFDFDGTLTKQRPSAGPPYNASVKIGANKENIERFKSYQQQGSKVYVVTAREETRATRQDVQNFLDHHQLKPDGIHFTNREPKVDTLINLNVQLHHDDDENEIIAIEQSGANIQTVHVEGPPMDQPDPSPQAMNFAAGMQL